MSRNLYPVQNKIRPENVLLNVSDKSGLDVLVAGLYIRNPNILFYATSGDGKVVQEVLGKKAKTNYVSIEEFTGVPEMDGGEFKTLHPKIYAGLLAERNNPAHQQYLFETMATMGKGPGVYFDLVVCNLYPFGEAVSQAGTNAEVARINIDIEGSTMLAAAAKNWHSVVVLFSPVQYKRFLDALSIDGGYTYARSRFALAQKALEEVSDDRLLIGKTFKYYGVDSAMATIELV